MLVSGCLGIFAVFIVLAFVAGGIIQAFALTSPPASASTTRTFPVTGVPTVHITVTGGSVQVTPGSAQEVRVQVTRTVHSTSRGEAQRELNNIAVDLTQTGDTVNIGVDEQGRSGGLNFYRNRNVRVTVSVPAQANLAIKADAGNVEVSGVSGLITTDVDAGNTNLHDVTFSGGSHLRGNAGNITAEGVLTPGASLDVREDFGNVDLALPRSTSAHLDAAVQAGNITVTGWTVSKTRDGSTTTASGDLTPQPAGSLTVHVDAGNITLRATE
jgi:hypothetical protein